MILQALLLVTKQAEPIKGIFIRLLSIVLSSALHSPLIPYNVGLGNIGALCVRYAGLYRGRYAMAG